MATLEPHALRVELMDPWERAIDSATFAGIVGDAAHRLDGGYHISREDQPATNYSVADVAADREGRPDQAAAGDMKMLPADMILVTGRLYRSFSDLDDPRLNRCRGVNGTLDGRTAIRFDCQFGTVDEASDDHLWHVHLEIIRKWADDPDTMRMILSVIVGQTYQQYLGGGDDGMDALERAELGNIDHRLQAITALVEDIPGGISDTVATRPAKAPFVAAFKQLAADVAAMKTAMAKLTTGGVDPDAVADRVVAKLGPALLAKLAAAERAEAAVLDGTSP